ncbi:manganese efflux pump [Blastococcus deserti]|uniref:Manganese efflux pump n=1 Tax=Blastococcus deserti TaxID=2259033 RepID=A0ABW4X7U6_9ACTN
MTLLAGAVLVGVDNLRFSLAAGQLGLPRRRRHQLVAAFGLAEGLAPLAGVAATAPLATALGRLADPLAAAALLVAAALVLVPLVRGAGPALPDSRWAVVLLPPLLALDNVAAGAGLRAFDLPLVPAALVMGVVSASIAAAGLLAGSAARRILKGAGPLVAGLTLVAAAAVTLA